jgi:hypothetical protein
MLWSKTWHVEKVKSRCFFAKTELQREDRAGIKPQRLAKQNQ